jgi:DNA-binding CsgD family transcriptional regulator/PAS domain-containing protein
MSLSANAELKLIGDIYDAALEPQLWPQVLQQISEHWAAHMVNLFIGDQLNPKSLVLHSHGATDETRRVFFDGGFAKADMELGLQWAKRGAIVGEAIGNHVLFGSIESFKEAAGDVYTHCYTKVGILYQLGMMLEVSDYRYAVTSFNRGLDEQPFSDSEAVAATRLAPHLRRAVQIHRQLSHVRQQQERLYRMLDNMVAGVILLDMNCRVRYANPAAELLLSASSVLKSSARYGLKAANEGQWKELNDLIQGAIKTGLRERHSSTTDQSSGVMALTNSRGDNLLMLTVTPLSEMSGYEDLASDGIAAGIFITDPHAKRVIARSILQNNYLLNERETDVCEAFLNCASLEGVADTLGLSLLTVRGYMKDIYAKTRMHSQAELMKFLMGLTIEFEHIRS